MSKQSALASAGYPLPASPDLSVSTLPEMSPATEKTPDSHIFTETELTLAPPGSSRPESTLNLSSDGSRRPQAYKYICVLV